MSEISRPGRLGFAACVAGLVGGGALSQGTAEAARVPEAAIVRISVFDDGDSDVDDNLSRVSGRKNNVTANSPTKNIGNQHNSSNNSAGQITFQYALCKRTKNCRISQRVIVKRHFVGFSGPVRERWGKDTIDFPWGTTVVATMLRPSTTSLSVKSP